MEVAGHAGEHPLVARARQILGPSLDRHLHDPVLVELAGQREDALALELPADRPGLGHGAAAAGEEVAHLGAGAVPVVGKGLDDHGHATGGVALVVHGLVADALELPLPRLIARSMVSRGTEASRAFWYMARSVAFAV